MLQDVLEMKENDRMVGYPAAFGIVSLLIPFLDNISSADFISSIQSKFPLEKIVFQPLFELYSERDENSHSSIALIESSYVRSISQFLFNINKEVYLIFSLH